MSEMQISSQMVPLMRLSVDMLSEIFGYLNAFDISYFFVACPPRFRHYITSQAVKDFCVQPSRGLTPYKPRAHAKIITTSKRQFGHSFAAFRGLLRLSLLQQPGSTLQFFPLVNEVVTALPKTLKTLELQTHRVLASFLTSTCQSPYLSLNVKAELPLPEWISMKNQFPALERLVLNSSTDSAKGSIFWRIRDISKFIKQLPETLGCLYMNDFPGLELEALKLLPPYLTDFRAACPTFMSDLAASPQVWYHSTPGNTQKPSCVLSGAVVAALPIHLTRLHFPAVVSYRRGENPFSLLPPNLTSIALNIEIPSSHNRETLATDPITFPSQVTSLNFCLNIFCENTLTDQLKLPNGLKKLKMRAPWTAILPKDYISSLPRTLHSLDLIHDRIPIVSSTWALFPPYLTKLAFSWTQPALLHLLPRTLRQLTIRSWAAAGISDALETLPPSMEYIEVPGIFTITADTFAAFPRLSHLLVPHGSVRDDIVLSLPPNVCEIRVDSIVASGSYLPDDLVAVGRHELICSVQHMVARAGPVRIQYSKIEASKITKCPPHVTSITDVSYSDILPKDLPRSLLRVFMPYHLLPSQIPDLPTALTTLNCEAVISASQLTLMPKTLTKLKRAIIVNDTSVEVLRQLPRTDKFVSFPRFPSFLVEAMFPNIYFSVVWRTTILPEHFSLIPASTEGLSLEDFPFNREGTNIFDSIKPLKSLLIANSILAQLFQDHLSHDGFHHATASFDIFNQSPNTIILPQGATHLTIRNPGCVLEHCVWPPGLQSLEISLVASMGTWLLRTPSSLSKLSLQNANPKLEDLDMEFIPRSVTSLSMNRVHLSKKCLNYLPMSITEINLPKSIFPASEILPTLAQRRREAASSSSYSSSPPSM